MAILDVRDLCVYYQTRQGKVRAIDGVTFAIEQGESLGLVGESGCGKTTVGKALLRLLADNAAIVRGQMLYKGTDLVTLGDARDARHPRQGDRHDPPERDERARPGHPDRRPDPGGDAGPPRDRRRGDPGAGRGTLRLGGTRGGPGRRLPAHVQRRDAPARGDRGDLRAPPLADHRRRADDRPGRHRPGPGAQTAGRPRPRDRRHADRHHPRHRDRGGKLPDRPG